MKRSVEARLAHLFKRLEEDAEKIPNQVGKPKDKEAVEDGSLGEEDLLINLRIADILCDIAEGLYFASERRVGEQKEPDLDAHDNEHAELVEEPQPEEIIPPETSFIEPDLNRDKEATKQIPRKRRVTLSTAVELGMLLSVVCAVVGVGWASLRAILFDEIMVYACEIDPSTKECIEPLSGVHYYVNEADGAMYRPYIKLTDFRGETDDAGQARIRTWAWKDKDLVPSVFSGQHGSVTDGWGTRWCIEEVVETETSHFELRFDDKCGEQE